MKIVHVVTYVSENGSFGGPTAVAIAQLKALGAQGHEVELVAGWDGRGQIAVPGVKISLFKTFRVWPGFTGLISPALFFHLLKNVGRGSKLHIHLGRDLMTQITAIIAMIKSVEFFVQTHGMIMPKRQKIIKFLDYFSTRPILKNASRILVLTDLEREGVSLVKKDRQGIEMIANGIADFDTSSIVRDERSIVFLARLHPRKRVLAFVEMCRLLMVNGVDFNASVIGPDEGDLPALQEAITKLNLDSHVKYEGTLSQGSAVERLAQAGVFVLPSFGEVFPMTVLESLVAGTPVVTTDQSGLAGLLTRWNAAIVTDGSPQQLMEAVSKILTDPKERKILTSNGSMAVEEEFSIDIVANQLSRMYLASNK